MIISIRVVDNNKIILIQTKRSRYMQNTYPYNMQEHVFDFKVKVNFQNGNVSLTAPQIVAPPAYFQNNHQTNQANQPAYNNLQANYNDHQPIYNNAQFSLPPVIQNSALFVPYNPYPQYIQPHVHNQNRSFEKHQMNQANNSFNSFRSSQFQINQSLQMIQCVLCQRAFNTNEFQLHLQMHKNRPTYSKQNQSNNGKTQNSVNQNSFNSYHKNQYSFQDNNSIGRTIQKQLAHFTPSPNMNHSISSQQNYMTRPPIQANINTSYQSMPGSSRDHPQIFNSRGINQNSMHYSSSSSNRSQFNNIQQILPLNFSNSSKNSSGSINNPNLIVVQQNSNGLIGPSFSQQTSRQNYPNSKQNYSNSRQNYSNSRQNYSNSRQNYSNSRQNQLDKDSSNNRSFNKLNNLSHQNYYQNGAGNTNMNKVNMKSIQSKYVKQNVSDSRNINSNLFNSLQDNNYRIFQDEGLSSISGQSRISEHSFSSQLSQLKSSGNKSHHYQSADISLRSQKPIQYQSQSQMERNSHKSQGNFYKIKSNSIKKNLNNSINSFNSKFKNQESSSDEQEPRNGKLSFNERIKQKQMADRQVQSIQLCQCKSVQLKSKMSNSKSSKFSDQSLSKTKLPVNYLARQDFISTSSSKSTHKQ